MIYLEQLIRRQSDTLNQSRSRENPFLLDGSNNLTKIEDTSLSTIVNTLGGPILSRRIDQGKLTFGLIRPSLELGEKKNQLDEVTARQIRQKILTSGFEIIFEIPVVFGPESVDGLYGYLEPRLRTIPVPPGQDLLGANAWTSFNNLMRIGASTAMLLCSEESDTQNPAFQKWRDLIGATNPEQALPSTIRFEYGTRVNNAVHGSDSPEAIHRETRWFAKKLRKLV